LEEYVAQLVSLSDQDLAQLRRELAAGRPPTVWFTPNAVGVEAGRSAKIVAFADTAEGDYVQVKPTGSKDVLSFSPSELTLTRPPRRKPSARPTRSTSQAAKPTARPVQAPAPKAASTPAPVQPPEVQPAAAPSVTQRASRPRPGSTSARAVELTVTLSSTPDGDWTVEVTAGKKRTVRALPVSPAEVAKAARALPAPVAQAVDAALDSARQQQSARVARLQAELEAAQRALNELG
jgi:hypothetical protein